MSELPQVPSDVTAHGPRDSGSGGYPLTQQLDPALPVGFPLPQLRSGSRAGYIHVGPEGWTGYWPPEDRAVPPDLAWTEAQRILVLATYQREWGRSLEENQTFDTTWPPEASLWTEGSVGAATGGCSRHDDPTCGECDSFNAVDGEIQPAEWRWSVDITTTEWNGHTGTAVGTEQFHFLTTLIDPRVVDFE